MIVKRIITITLETRSDVSEAASQRHADDMADALTNYAKRFKEQSWCRAIHVSCDESYPVTIEVETKIEKR